MTSLILDLLKVVGKETPQMVMKNGDFHPMGSNP